MDHKDVWESIVTTWANQSSITQDIKSIKPIPLAKFLFLIPHNFNITHDSNKLIPKDSIIQTKDSPLLDILVWLKQNMIHFDYWVHTQDTSYVNLAEISNRALSLPSPLLWTYFDSDPE